MERQIEMAKTILSLNGKKPFLQTLIKYAQRPGDTWNESVYMTIQFFMIEIELRKTLY